jgi:hypothetical protein
LPSRLNPNPAEEALQAKRLVELLPSFFRARGHALRFNLDRKNHPAIDKSPKIKMWGGRVA